MYPRVLGSVATVADSRAPVPLPKAHRWPMLPGHVFLPRAPGGTDPYRGQRVGEASNPGPNRLRTKTPEGAACASGSQSMAPVAPAVDSHGDTLMTDLDTTAAPPPVPPAWTLVLTTGRTKSICAACSDTIPVQTWRARAGRAGARVWHIPCAIARGLTPQTVDNWAALPFEATQLVQDRPEPPREHDACHAAAVAQVAAAPDLNGWKSMQEQLHSLDHLPWDHVSMQVATLRRVPQALHAEFADLLHHIAEELEETRAAISAEHADRYWKLLFLLPRLLLAAPPQSRAGTRGQGHAQLLRLVATRLAKLRNGDWSELHQDREQPPPRQSRLECGPNLQSGHRADQGAHRGWGPIPSCRPPPGPASSLPSRPGGSDVTATVPAADPKHIAVAPRCRGHHSQKTSRVFATT